MSLLLNLESNFNYLDSLQHKLDNFFEKQDLSNIDNDKISDIKYEILNTLSDILSIQSTEVLSNSFYTQVNYIEQRIYSLLEVKKSNLNILDDYDLEVDTLRASIISIIYSLDILQNSTHINVDVEKRLLDIKNSVSIIDYNNKKICAINFLKEKLPVYKREFINLLQIVKECSIKDNIPFQTRQEIFEIFKTVTLSGLEKRQYEKVFLENTEENYNNVTTDYIYFYENSFLEMCKMVDIKLTSHANEIVKHLNDKNMSSDMLANNISFIIKDYSFQMDNFLKSANDEIRKSTLNMYKYLSFCLTYDGATSLEKLLQKIDSDDILNKYIKDEDIRNKTKILLQSFNIKNRGKIQICNILDDLSNNIKENFDPKRYMELYIYNSKYKNRQIAQFRQYYIDVLEKAKIKVSNMYIERLNKLIKESKIEEYIENEATQKKNELVLQIEVLQQALKYINDNYRNFNDENLKLYINTIQERYNIENLYESVMRKKSKLLYKLKAKSILKKEQNKIYDFANNGKIKEKLQEELINNIFKENKDLIKEFWM